MVRTGSVGELADDLLEELGREAVRPGIHRVTQVHELRAAQDPIAVQIHRREERVKWVRPRLLRLLDDPLNIPVYRPRAETKWCVPLVSMELCASPNRKSSRSSPAVSRSQILLFRGAQRGFVCSGWVAVGGWVLPARVGLSLARCLRVQRS